MVAKRLVYSFGQTRSICERNQCSSIPACAAAYCLSEGVNAPVLEFDSMTDRLKRLKDNENWTHQNSLMLVKSSKNPIAEPTAFSRIVTASDSPTP